MAAVIQKEIKTYYGRKMIEIDDTEATEAKPGEGKKSVKSVALARKVIDA